MLHEKSLRTWTDEAGISHDVAALSPRSPVTTGRGSEPTKVIAVRLTIEELAALEAAAARKQLSRSDAIRAALARFAE